MPSLASASAALRVSRATDSREVPFRFRISPAAGLGAALDMGIALGHDITHAEKTPLDKPSMHSMPLLFLERFDRLLQPLLLVGVLGLRQEMAEYLHRAEGARQYPCDALCLARTAL